MKYFYLLSFLFAVTHSYAENVSGYIVTFKNDTIPVQIKIGGGFFFGIGEHDLTKTVETIDSAGYNQTYTPETITAFGCNYKKEKVIYRVKPIRNGSRRFLRAVVIGQKASLYSYGIFVSNGPYSDVLKEFYTFEKPDGTYLFLKNFDSLDSFRDKLKGFYSETPEILQLIDTKFTTRKDLQKDIEAILEAINRSL